MKPDDFRGKVVDALRRVGPGEVVSYGDLAAEAGFPGAARAVGSVLSAAGDEQLAWWRVVYADGRLAPGHQADQERRLAAEGVAVRAGRVVAARAANGALKDQGAAHPPDGRAGAGQGR